MSEKEQDRQQEKEQEKCGCGCQLSVEKGAKTVNSEGKESR
jgi:hypothetical protein